MFEHLGPVPETKIKRYTSKFKLYVGFLVLAVIVFTFSFSIGQGPDSLAQEYEDNANIIVKVQADSIGRTYLADADNFEIFNFNINTDRPGIVLYKIKFTIKGLYDIELMNDLKLFHQSVQLGDIKEIDLQGNVYFNIANYVLPLGDNYFSLVIPKKDNVNYGDIIQVSLEDSLSLTSQYQGHLLTARGDFPIVSGPSSFVGQGDLEVLSKYNKFSRVAELPQQLFSFELDNHIEPVNVNQLTLAYQTDGASLANKDFVLIHNRQILVLATAGQEQIVFNLTEPLVIDDSLDIELHALSLPEGNYTFSLVDWQVRGVISEKDIIFSEPIFLADLKASSYFLEFFNGNLKNALSTGWNELYNMKLVARGQDNLSLYKLTWVVDAQGAKLDQAEVWVDDQIYIADIVLTGDKIIVKANWEKPIVVDKQGTDIKLLIKVGDLKERAKVEAYLLTDELPLADNSSIANILWAHQDEIYNSYALPYLPLLPNILNN